jgi:hypothetical protein
VLSVAAPLHARLTTISLNAFVRVIVNTSGLEAASAPAASVAATVTTGTASLSAIEPFALVGEPST